MILKIMQSRLRGWLLKISGQGNIMKKQKNSKPSKSLTPINSAKEHLEAKKHVGKNLIAFLKKQGYLKKKKWNAIIVMMLGLSIGSLR